MNKRYRVRNLEKRKLKSTVCRSLHRIMSINICNCISSDVVTEKLRPVSYRYGIYSVRIPVVVITGHFWKGFLRGTFYVW